jgi:hypothetical protein
LFVPVEDLEAFVGHVGPVELDGAGADEFVGEEDGEGEFGLLVVAFEDGVAVVALLVRRDEVGVDFHLGFADLYAEGGDVLECA